MKSKKKFYKRKLFWGILIGVLVLAAAIVALIVIKGKMNAASALEALSIKSTTVEKGTISETIEGSGSIAVADTADIYIPSGLTLSEVLVEEGDTVTAGQKLAEIDSDSILDALVSVEKSLDQIDDSLDSSSLTSLQKEQLQTKQSELTLLQTTLTAYKESPYVLSLYDGVIGSINNSGSSTQNNSNDSLTSGTRSAASIMLTAGTAQITEDTQEKNKENQEQNNDDPPEEEDTPVKDFSITGTDILNIKPVKSAAPVKTLSDTTPYGYSSVELKWLTTDGNTYTGGTFAAGTVYLAEFSLICEDGYVFDDTSAQAFQNVITQLCNNGTITKCETPTVTAESVTVRVTYSKTAAETTPTNNTGTGTSSSGTGTASTSSTSTSTADLYSTEETSVFTINLQNNVKVTISIDELDILNVKTGQKATVTLDALEGEEFEGTISKVATSSSSSNGSAKYSVEITIPKDENMLMGMSATAVITLNEAKDVLVIPMDALQQRGDQLFVYTEQDEEGNLSGEVTVETGLSDSSQVEITSGLSEGDTVYYTRESSGNSSSDFMNGGFGGFGGEMPSGGMEMPSGGGDMPSGGGNGGGMPSGGGGGGMPSGGGPSGNQ